MNRKQRKAKLRAARARQQQHRDARTAAARRESEQRPTVEGEDPWEILRALAQIQKEPDDGGLSMLRITLPQEEAAPLARALMRLEAELLIEDAAVWTAADGEKRTDDQRRFDALMLVVDRTCVAIEAQGHHNRVEL